MRLPARLRRLARTWDYLFFAPARTEPRGRLGLEVLEVREVPSVTVYDRDFNPSTSATLAPGVTAAWSNTTKPTTPSGESFLGEFGNQTVTFNLNNIPTHNQLTVEFDLYVIRSWDGNDPTWGGPNGDRWSFKADGATLLDTTFRNPRTLPSNDSTQEFGGQGVTGSGFAPGTGAAAINTLGYTFDGGTGTQPLDAVYHFRFPISHAGQSLTLAFTGSGLQGLSDESWGLDNVRVTVPPPVVTVEKVTDAVEGGTQGKFRLIRTGDTSQSLTVNVGTAEDMGGDPLATWPDDFTMIGPAGAVLGPSGGTVTFDANKTSVDLSVLARQDILVESPEAFRLTVLPGAGYQPGSDPGASSAVMRVTDQSTAPAIEDQEFAIPEELSNGDIVGFVRASDADPGQTLTYSITAGNVDGAFSIDADTGIVRVANAGALDFTTNPTFSLTVQVTDNGIPTRSATATIDISLVNFDGAGQNDLQNVTGLNDLFDDIWTIYHGGTLAVPPGPEITYKGLSPENADGPVRRATEILNELSPLSAAMLATVLLAPDAYAEAQGDYRLGMTNLATHLSPIYANATDALHYAKAAVVASEGDRFRIQGIKTLLAGLDGYLAGVQQKVNAELLKMTGIGTQLATNLFRFFGDTAYWSFVTNLTLASSELAALRGQIAGATDGVQFEQNGFIGELNGVASQIQSDLDLLDPNDPASDLGDVLAVMDQMYDVYGRNMVNTYANPDQQQVYNSNKTDYLNALGYLVGSVNPAANVYPNVDPEDLDYRASNNFGAIGGVFADADELLGDADTAYDLMGQFAVHLVEDFGTSVPDKFRSYGLHSYLDTLGERLGELQATIDGEGEDPEEGVMPTGLAPQVSYLFDGLQAANLNMLFAVGDRDRVVETYLFVDNGRTDPDGAILARGVQQYFGEITDRLDDLPI